MKKRILKGYSNAKKGLSLVELIIVLSILFTIISLCTINYFRLYNNWSNSANIDYCNNYILHMIKNSAVYCKYKNKSGYLLFGESEKVKFFCGNKKVNEYELPSGFKFIDTASFNQRISINNLGNVIKACTINYKDMKGKPHSITIRVATRYVQIK